MCSMVWIHSPIGSKDLSWWCIFNPAKPSLYPDTWLNKMVYCCWIIEAFCTNYWYNHIINVWFCVWLSCRYYQWLSNPNLKVIITYVAYCNVPIRSALPNISAPKRSANLHKIVAPPQNRSAPVSVLAPNVFNINFMESLHKNIVQTPHVLQKIAMAATTTRFTSDGLGRRLYVV